MLHLLVYPVALFSVFLSAFYFYMTSRFNYWKERGVPGPKPWPLFGTFPCTVTGKRNFVCDLDDIYREFKGKAKFVGVFMTRNPQIMIIDPVMAREVLVNNFKCFMDNESSKWMDKDVEPIAGGNPFVMTGNAWKNKRSEILPGLTVSKTKAMYPVIGQAAKRLVEFIKENTRDALDAMETKDIAMKFTGEVVADVVWGIEANAFQKNNCIFVDMAYQMIQQSFHAVGYFFMLGFVPFVRRFYRVRVFPAVTDRFFTKLTEMSLQLRKDAEVRQDFLGHIIQLKEKKNLSITDVVAHNLTFLFDGFETSAGLISHCLLLLSRNPECQARLRRELKENSAKDGSISFDDLNRLPYLDQVINETLRIFVPLAFMSKLCTEPCELTNTDGSKHQVRKGDVVLISTYSYHHDEEYFPEPENFCPERFSEENGGAKKYKDLGVYMPFGDGPRICLGMRFGLTQAKSAVAEVVKTFQMTLDDTRTVTDNSIEPKGFILNLKGGIYIRYKQLYTE